MTAPLDPFRPTTPEQRRTRKKIAAGHRLAEIRAAALRREIREAGQRGVSLARLRQEGRERLSAIVAELGIEGP